MEQRVRWSISVALAGLLVAASASGGTMGAMSRTERNRIAQSAGRLRAVDLHARAESRHSPQRTVRFTVRRLGLTRLRREVSALQAGRRAISRNPFRRAVEAQVVSLERFGTTTVALEDRSTLRSAEHWSTFMRTSVAGKLGADTADLDRPYDPHRTGANKGFASIDHGRVLRKWSRAVWRSKLSVAGTVTSLVSAVGGIAVSLGGLSASSPTPGVVGGTMSLLGIIGMGMLGPKSDRAETSAQNFAAKLTH